MEEFIKIEGGVYTLACGTHEIETFEIDKHPVTNLRFGKFIKDGGYKKFDWWSEDGLRWLVKEKSNHPRYWYNAEWNAFNHPVVGVCWYEAEAFCNWLTLTQGDGYYRLPTEIEWEAAAAGFEKRIYPWGDEWHKNHCNTSEIGIKKTSKVGMFKLGDTPKGVSDMSGNVWEWTIPKKEDGSMVLRGGSFNFNNNYARCDDHSRVNPYIRYFSVGFRCVRTNQRKCYPAAHKALWKHRAETNGDLPWPEWKTEGGNYESVINDCFACKEAYLRSKAKGRGIIRSDCKYCPLDFEVDCHQPSSLWSKWISATKTSKEEARTIALQIANTPWKEEKP